MKLCGRYFGFLVLIALVGCASTPTLPSSQRRTFESKDLKGAYDDAFKATLQVLQDYGYIIKSADYKAGVIQGETGIKKNLSGLMTNFEITATMEQFGEAIVKERLSLIRIERRPLRENSTIVDDPELFQRMYDDIQREMFVRSNLTQ